MCVTWLYEFSHRTSHVLRLEIQWHDQLCVSHDFMNVVTWPAMCVTWPAMCVTWPAMCVTWPAMCVTLTCDASHWTNSLIIWTSRSSHISRQCDNKIIIILCKYLCNIHVMVLLFCPVLLFSDCKGQIAVIIFYAMGKKHIIKPKVTIAWLCFIL